MLRKTVLAFIVALILIPLWGFPAQPWKALIIDGQNNHDWQATTPVLRRLLEDTGLFQVDVSTSPPKGQGMEDFKPEFKKYRLVVSNYNGEDWAAETRRSFEEYVGSGGGVIIYHASDNPFPQWKEYNEIIGLGGWGERNEKSGPYVRFRDGRFVLDNSPGRAGSHGKQHAFQITVRNQDHPITKGLPTVWMHGQDELYDRLRGPARNVTWLATAYSDPKTGGSGENEPMLFVVTYGRGRVFHTTLGHGPEAMRSIDFIVTLQRGAEWAASGKVTQKVPPDFPGPGNPSTR